MTITASEDNEDYAGSITKTFKITGTAISKAKIVSEFKASLPYNFDDDDHLVFQDEIRLQVNGIDQAAIRRPILDALGTMGAPRRRNVGRWS